MNDHALAARLSYFLWSSLPDDELTASWPTPEPFRSLAVLRAQPVRMLDDPRSADLWRTFSANGSHLRDIAATSPDRKLYPEYMPWLQEAMLMEARAYFTEMLRSDLGITHFVQSDFAYLNEPLAELYGIEGRTRLGFATRRAAQPAARAAASSPWRRC